MGYYTDEKPDLQIGIDIDCIVTVDTLLRAVEQYITDMYQTSRPRFISELRALCLSMRIIGNQEDKARKAARLEEILQKEIDRDHRIPDIATLLVSEISELRQLSLDEKIASFEKLASLYKRKRFGEELAVASS